MSIATIYDIFDIHELIGFTGGSSFFILYLKFFFSLSFVIYDRLFVIYDRFSKTSCQFQIFVLNP